MFSASGITGVFIAGSVLMLLAALLVAVRVRIPPLQANDEACLALHIRIRDEAVSDLRC